MRSPPADAGGVDEHERLRRRPRRRCRSGRGWCPGTSDTIIRSSTRAPGSRTSTCRCSAAPRSRPAAAPSRSRPARPAPPRSGPLVGGRCRRLRLGSAAAGASTMRSARSPVLRPCWALTVIVGSKPRAKNSTASASRAGLSPLLTTRITGASARRRRSATSWSSGASPACGVDHEEDEVGLLDRHARLVLDALLDVACPARAPARRCRPP